MFMTNGIAERANRTLLDGARAMLESSQLPEGLWAEAVSHHVWIRNRVPTRSLKHDKTPYELATGKKPDLSGIHPWGSKAWVKRLDVGKLEPRAEIGRFVGVDSESKGLRIYWPGKNRVSIERDVYFNEKDVYEPEEVLIEGDSNTHTNFNAPQPSTSSQPIENAETNTIEPDNPAQVMPDSPIIPPEPLALPTRRPT